MAHRAWHAWNCLPKTSKGERPPIRELEREHEISNAALGKLIKGKLKRPGLEQLTAFAAALRTTPEWLQFGTGKPPVSAWQVPGYPSEWLPVSAMESSRFRESADELLDEMPVPRARSTRK